MVIVHAVQHVLVERVQVLVRKCRGEDDRRAVLERVRSNGLLDKVHVLRQELRLFAMNQKINLVADDDDWDAEVDL